MGILSMKDYAEVNSLDTPFTTRGNSWTSVASATKILTNPESRAYIFRSSSYSGAQMPIDALNISILSNSVYTGDSGLEGNSASTASSTECFKIGGRTLGISLNISSIDFSSSSTMTLFGTLKTQSENGAAGSDFTRAIYMGGYDGSSYISEIQYFNMSSFSSTETFGNLTGTSGFGASTSSPTTIVILLGLYNSASSAYANYVTTASLGDAVAWGNVGGAYYNKSGCGSATIGLFSGGSAGAVEVKEISSILFSTTGSNTVFGNLSENRAYHAGVSNSTRAIWAGGRRGTTSLSNTSLMEYNTISTSGNGVLFADLSFAADADGESSAHGGLQ